jgi:ketosteroid isomerase-like protein
MLYSFPALQAQNLSKEVDSALNEIDAKMVKATLAGEYLSLMDYYTEDVVMMPDFRPAIRGKKELLAQYQEDIKLGVKYHSFNATVEKKWQCGSEIFERGTFGMAISSKNSQKPMAFYGSYFQIWQKQPDGSFKITFIIWNLDFNPFES